MVMINEWLTLIHTEPTPTNMLQFCNKLQQSNHTKKWYNQIQLRHNQLLHKMINPCLLKILENRQQLIVFTEVS